MKKINQVVEGIFLQEYYGISHKSIGQLSNLKKYIELCSSKSIELNTKFFKPFCIAYLDQVMQTINKKKRKKILSKDSGVNSYLQQCGFKYLCKNAKMGAAHSNDDIIKIKRFRDEKKLGTSVVNWLEKIVLKYIPNCSRQLRKKIVESLWEIVNNAFAHGKSKNGISCCGQYYPQKKYLEIAFYDAGYGLVNRVRNFNPKKFETFDDSDCIEWAMEKGNSTLNKADAGLGLFLLRKFIKVNLGAFQIIAGNGYFGDMEEENDIKHTLTNSIDGTLVNIRVNISDNISYKLKGEKNENN